MKVKTFLGTDAVEVDKLVNEMAGRNQRGSAPD